MDSLPSTTQPTPQTLYAELHDRLYRNVRYAVTTSAANAEDACQFAWLQLLQTAPDCGDRIFAWLKTVAIREAIRLDRGERAREPLGDGLAEVLTDPGAASPELALEAGEALAAVADLPERQQSVLSLQAAGYSYAEIAERTGQSTRSVDRQLVRARRSLSQSGTEEQVPPERCLQ